VENFAMATGACALNCAQLVQDMGPADTLLQHTKQDFKHLSIIISVTISYLC